ncbi:hypothetical protein KC320_g249 [Hortaea werneckii]|nr:hypothetical protein KC320_g249 [Hortaea werneckii]
MPRLLRQRHRHNQPVDLLAQEMQPTLLIQPAIPRRRDLPVLVSRPRHNEPLIFPLLRRVLRRCRVRQHIHPHSLRHAADLAANTSVPQHAEPTAHHIVDVVEVILR